MAESNISPLWSTATISLIEEVDKRVLLVLRDGRKLVGTFRSFDQFANMVFEDVIERIFVDNKYCEKKLGTFIIRGENIVILGEIDTELELSSALKLELVPGPDLMKLFDEEKKKKEEQQKMRRKSRMQQAAQPGNEFGED